MRNSKAIGIALSVLLITLTVNLIVPAKADDEPRDLYSDAPIFGQVYVHVAEEKLVEVVRLEDETVDRLHYLQP